MNDEQDPVARREQSMRLQLAGISTAATQAQAEAGLARAQEDLTSGRGRAYGLGLGFVTARSARPPSRRSPLPDHGRQAAATARP
jgi:hypothetical protein